MTYNDIIDAGAAAEQEAFEALLQDAFDAGYLEGVHDARLVPEEADAYIRFLIEQDHLDFDDGFEHSDNYDELDY